MKFKAERTSVYSDGADPHFPGAYPESTLKKRGDKSVHIQEWFVDIDTIEQLVELAGPEDSWASLIISAPMGEMPTLEIYDSWRE